MGNPGFEQVGRENPGISQQSLGSFSSICCR